MAGGRRRKSSGGCWVDRWPAKLLQRKYKNGAHVCDKNKSGKKWRWMAKWPRGKGKREHEWEVDVCQSPQEEEEAAAEGGLCMCVCAVASGRERAGGNGPPFELYFFFVFACPLLAWVIFYFSATATWVRSKLSAARLFAQANKRHTLAATVMRLLSPLKRLLFK